MTTDYRKLPSRVLYVLSGVTVLVFALFWLVGFNRPYDEDGNFNAPLFTDVLLVLMLLLTAGAIGDLSHGGYGRGCSSRNELMRLPAITYRALSYCVIQ